MWPVAVAALLFGGPFGVVMFLAAGITAGIRTWKVDAEFARKGQLPPSARLVDKWLDNRKAAGTSPQSAKVKKYGSWAYAKQRWQAMWEDLGDTHQEVRDRYRQAKREAAVKGVAPPPKPTWRETLTGWKWQLDQPVPPTPDNSRTAGPGMPHAVDPTSPAPRRPSPRTRPAPAASPTSEPAANTRSFPRTGTCGKCRKPSDGLTVIGWCQPCVTESQHGFCRRCHRLIVRDGDTMRHGPNQTGCVDYPYADIDTPREPNPARTTDPTPAAQPARRPEPPRTENRTTSEGEPMTTAPTSGEVTGIPSALHYMTQVAATHLQHGGNEQLLTAMHNMNIGGGDISLVQAAQEKSRNAAELWTGAAQTIEQHNAGVRQGYASAPDAADKHAQMAE